MRIAAVLLGAVLYALALPPFDWSICGWVAMLPLLLAIRGVSTRSAFRYGLLGGYAFGWAITWSIAEMGAEYFRLPMPLTVAAFALYYLVVCGVPFALFSAGAALALRSGSWERSQLVIPLVWVASELFRVRVIGQPWALLGYTQHDHLALLQVAACTGVYGISFLLVLGAAAVAEAMSRLFNGAGTRSTMRPLMVPAAVVGACWLGGALFLREAPSDGSAAREIAIVQTNVSPARYWTRSYTQSQVSAHVLATNTLAGSEHPALIVWPENSVPRYLEREPMLAVELAGVAVRHHADILFGGPRYENGKVYNTARLITATGRNGGHYDKRRLLLFAEEKPFVSLAARGPSETPEEFSPGTDSGLLSSFVRLGVSICHEITYPDLIAREVSDGADLLVNIANDGWLDAGYEFAGRQHLAMAVFRAVETRRWVIRAATTGTSAVIDPYGRVTASQRPGTSGVVRARVAGRSTLTPYALFGDWFAFACVGIAVAVLAWDPARRAARRAVPAQLPATS